jgi:LysR family hydrogen peroxide-inducible transcriptional activator
MTAGDGRSYRHPWLGVEVRHLATLIAVARTRSFRQAAAELGYVQSAVSQQISALEHVVGTRLVDRRRGHRQVTLTPAGELLLERSIGIIGQLRAARADMSVADGEGAVIVRLAVVADIAPWLLSRLLPELMTALPGLRLRVTEIGSDDELSSRLERGTADLAIGCPLADGRLASTRLLDDPFVLLVAGDSPLAEPGAISSPADLAGVPLIVSESMVADAHIRAAGLRLDRALRAPVAAAVPTLVSSGLGVGVLPRSEAPDVRDDVAVLSVPGLIAPRRILLCWHAARRRTAILESFTTLAVSACSERRGRTAVTLSHVA